MSFLLIEIQLLTHHAKQQFFLFFCCPGHFLANDLPCGDCNHDDFTPSKPNHNVPTPISATNERFSLQMKQTQCNL
jgi:hypothetical protein